MTTAENEGHAVDSQSDRRDGPDWPRNRQRERVLRLVREHSGAIDAATLAASTGLHVTTVRFHLDALCEEGRVNRTRMNRPGVGRPRTGYAAAEGRLDYQRLAEVLAMELGDTVTERKRRAQRVGRRWADRMMADSPAELVAQHDVPGATGSGDVLDRRAAMTADAFGRMGFGPELTPATELTADERRRTIRLHDCPLRDLARAHPEVACAMHLGLLRGLLANGSDSSDATTFRAELEPFVESELCIATVIAHD